MAVSPEELKTLGSFLHISVLDTAQFLYVSPQSWEHLPFLHYETLEQAEYPSTVSLPGTRMHPVDFPISDFVIERSGKPSILFTGAHNRLKYEAQKGLLIPHVGRNLIYVDDHDDIDLGKNEHRFFTHIGNWISHGAADRYWNEVAQLSSNFNGLALLGGDYHKELKGVMVGHMRVELPYYQIALKNQPESRNC